VGDLTYLGQKFYDDTAQKKLSSGDPQITQNPSPIHFSNLQKVWNNLTTRIDWQVPGGYGAYVLVSIRPSFFPASPRTR
jgi:hypothetical protein